MILDIEVPNGLKPQEQRFAALLTFGFFLFCPFFPGMIHMTKWLILEDKQYLLGLPLINCISI